MNPTDRKYSKEHEWVKIESGDVALVGITHFAQDQLGDIVFVYFPDDLETSSSLSPSERLSPPRPSLSYSLPSAARSLRSMLSFRIAPSSSTRSLMKPGGCSKSNSQTPPKWTPLCQPTSTKPLSPSLSKTSAKLPPTDNADKP